MMTVRISQMKRLARWGIVVCLVLAGAYLGALSLRIARQAAVDEARPADVILVLGAAEYRGRPSPVLKARLDHALDLYKRQLAPLILTTGGSGGDPDYTEGDVGRSYLIGLGVPAEAIAVERESDSTAHSVAAAGEIMERMGQHSCIVVSDGYHILRAKMMIESRGIVAYGSPRPGGGAVPWWIYPREAASYLIWAIGLR